jgi:hypothetical protein
MSNSNVPSEKITRDELIKRYLKGASLAGLNLRQLNLSNKNIK